MLVHSATYIRINRFKAVGRFCLVANSIEAFPLHRVAVPRLACNTLAVFL